MSSTKRTRTIRTDYLARVEGEGAMYVELEGDVVRDVKLRIYEPPRFFEALLRGRAFTEAPDITSRICGICPSAYQISAIRAIEDACGIAIDAGPIRDLRRLIYCGEWIESLGLHVYLLHAPDFLGYPGFVEMAGDHPKIAEHGLALKKAGNTIVTVLGGREIHPINLRVGGFYRTPTPAELRNRLVAPLERAREIALDIAASEFDEHMVEEHVEHSNALHSRIRERGNYLTGPLARYNLAFAHLWPLARDAALHAGIGEQCRNPFQSIVVRSVEILQACDEALAIVERYEQPDQPTVEVRPRHAVGHSATEAPRGLLYHRYEIDDDGSILDARIVPPTSQNQLSIEEDLRAVVQRHVELSDEELRHVCEQAIRNHDPCISCATHFLELTVKRR